MLTGFMVQYKAGLSGNSDIGVQSVNWFVHFSAAGSSNGTGASVQQRQVLDPHSREQHRFLFSLLMKSLTNEFTKDQTVHLMGSEGRKDRCKKTKKS